MLEQQVGLICASAANLKLLLIVAGCCAASDFPQRILAIADWGEHRCTQPVWLCVTDLCDASCLPDPSLLPSAIITAAC